MMQRPQVRQYTWDDVRSAVCLCSPDSIKEYDELMEADNKRGAIGLLQKIGIISPDSWVHF